MVALLKPVCISVVYCKVDQFYVQINRQAQGVE